MKKQVETRRTVGVDEALSEIEDEPLAISYSFPEGGVATVRRAPDDRTVWLVDSFVPAVGGRRVVEVEDTDELKERIRNSDTASIVAVEDTPRWETNDGDE